MNCESHLDRLKMEIEDLREKRKAVILAHNYQAPEVQDVADYVGDSLELTRMAVKVDAEVLVFARALPLDEKKNTLLYDVEGLTKRILEEKEEELHQTIKIKDMPQARPL